MTASTFLDGRVTLHAGDCLEVLAGMEENSVDSVVCDPPYHLTSIVKRFGGDMPARTEATVGKHAYGRHASGFMGKVWDGGDIAFQPATWAAVLRVLKPGGYVLAFASTRGFGRMSVAIEEAGFNTHPLTTFITEHPDAEAFLRSLDREQFAAFLRLLDHGDLGGMLGWIFGSGFPKATRIKADGFDGFRYGGQALKPAIEPIYMGQKPFSEANGTANILLHGTGALNIDGCRVEGEAVPVFATAGGQKFEVGCRDQSVRQIGVSSAGRWPANIIHDGSEEVVAAFPDAPGQLFASTTAPRKSGNVYGKATANRTDMPPRGGSGSAARFFYTAKADADDRLGSKHPTVKPLDLMQYLVRLVTPPSGLCCESCGRRWHGNRAKKASQSEAVRTVRDDVPPDGQSGEAAFLLEGVREQRDAPEASSLRGMRDAVSPDGGQAEVLRSDVLAAVDSEKQEDHERLRGDEKGLSPAPHAGTSAGQEGLYSGASLRGGAGPRQAAETGRGGPSHQRREDGQSSGKPSTDAEGGSRQAQPASPERNHVPLLRDGDDDQPPCSHCGGKVSFRHSVVLDPFAGTGTTGEAAFREGMRAVLIEREPEYQADIARRMELAQNPTKRAAVAKTKNNLRGAEGTPLFGDVA